MPWPLDKKVPIKSSPCYCVLFFDKTPCIYSASLHPKVQIGILKKTLKAIWKILAGYQTMDWHLNQRYKQNSLSFHKNVPPD